MQKLTCDFKLCAIISYLYFHDVQKNVVIHGYVQIIFSSLEITILWEFCGQREFWIEVFLTCCLKQREFVWN